MTSEPSPYVGPRPFETEDQGRFFGRDREASDLLSLVVAHRAVLLYAQSGAGKTSLVNARVVPMQRDEEFEVFPTARLRATLIAALGEIGSEARSRPAWCACPCATT